MYMSDWLEREVLEDLKAERDALLERNRELERAMDEFQTSPELAAKWGGFGRDAFRERVVVWLRGLGENRIDKIADAIEEMK